MIIVGIDLLKDLAQFAVVAKEFDDLFEFSQLDKPVLNSKRNANDRFRQVSDYSLHSNRRLCRRA